MNDLSQVGSTAIDTWAKRGIGLHCAVFLADGRILGTETFRLVGFSGRESVSQPFQFQLELHANTDLSGKDPIRFSGTQQVSFDFSDVIGRPVTVGIDEPAPGQPADAHDGFAKALAGEDAAHLSLFNGMVVSFSMGAPGVYHLTMQPALWRLSLTNAYKVHHGKSIRDAIADILKRHKVAFSMTAVSGNDNPAVTRIQDWLQAGESDFDFIQRLMAKASIYYYFEHAATEHKLVFANRPNYPQAYADHRRLRYTHTSEESLGLEQDDVITDYRYSRSLVSSGVMGSLVRQEAAWEKDTVADCQAYQASSAPDLGELPFYRYQVCQYGGCKDEVAWETGRVNAARDTSATELSGSSHCVRFRSGYQFQLAEGAVDGRSIQPQLAGTPFVLTEVEHKADAGGSYSNSFKATEATGLITPFSLHDTQQGVVLAQVVRHENGTPPGDWRYYQKQNFDPEQESLDQSACQPASLHAKGVYVRFVTDQAGDAPAWVKLAPHMQTVPEIGVIVQVSRANDYTELPEIQSIIQNNGNKVVTPSGWTARSDVGSNYSTNYGDSKSVRFGRNSVPDLDTAVAKVTEKYASGKYRDCSFSQGGGYSYSTAEQGRSGLLSDSESYGSTYNRQQGAESKSWSDIDYSYRNDTVGNSDSYSVVTGKSYSESTVGETENHSTVNTDSKSYDTVVGEQYRKSKLGKVTDYSTITGDEYRNSTIQGSSTSVSVVQGHRSSNTTLSTAADVTVAVAQSNSSAIGAENRNSVVDISNSNSLSGIVNNNSLTALSNNNSLTEVVLNLSGTLVSTDISQVGTANRVSLTGTSNSVDVAGVCNEMTNKPAAQQLDLKGTEVSLLSLIKLIM